MGGRLRRRLRRQRLPDARRGDGLLLHAAQEEELGHAEREDDAQDQEEPESGKTPQARPARPEARHRPEPDQGLLQGLLRLLARRGLRDLRREYRLDEEVKTVVSFIFYRPSIITRPLRSTDPCASF